MTPTVSPSRTLKFATDLRALVVMGFWPVMVAMSLQMASISLALPLDSPQPTLTMTLLSFGICITDLYWNLFMRAGAISSVYFTFSLAMFQSSLSNFLAALLADADLLAVGELHGG